jgi:hypothetical protein
VEFTFGICATKDNKEYHNAIIESILSLDIPKCEILIIGDLDCIHEYATLIPFEEGEKFGWITRKKNILCQNARLENIVLLHDYIVFDKEWYKGFLEFGNDFDVAMNIILNYNGERFRDWCLNPYDVIPPKGPLNNRQFFLPYDIHNLTNKMYISGTYWVAKTQFMLNNPLNENLCWGESEDMDWSYKAREKTNFKMNSNSIVKSLKYKYCDFELITPENLSLIYV